MATECLGIFTPGSHTSLKMVYKRTGSPLKLVLKKFQDNLKSTCTIYTNDSDRQLDFTMDDDTVKNSIVFNSSNLLEFLKVIDKTENELKIEISPQHIRFSTMINSNSTITVMIEKTSNMINSFISNEVTKNQYNWNHIQFIMRALSLGNSVSMQTGAEGLLLVKVQLVHEQVRLEYFILPLVEENTNV